MVDGVIFVPLEKYAVMHTRLCRPVWLTAEDREKVIGYALARLGHRHDLKNIVDPVRYLLPQPPAPRDFDISPYFEIVKPTLENGFDYRSLRWEAATLRTVRPRYCHGKRLT